MQIYRTGPQVGILIIDLSIDWLSEGLVWLAEPSTVDQYHGSICFVWIKGKQLVIMICH